MKTIAAISEDQPHFWQACNLQIRCRREQTGVTGQTYKNPNWPGLLRDGISYPDHTDRASKLWDDAEQANIIKLDSE